MWYEIDDPGTGPQTEKYKNIHIRCFVISSMFLTFLINYATPGTQDPSQSIRTEILSNFQPSKPRNLEPRPQNLNFLCIFLYFFNSRVENLLSRQLQVI